MSRRSGRAPVSHNGYRTRELQMPAWTRLLVGLLPLLALLSAPRQSPAADGVLAELEGDHGSATLATDQLDRFRLRLRIDRHDAARPLTLRVQLPQTGRTAWPVADVEVRSENGQALLVQRSGIEWQVLRIPLPDEVDACLVQAVEPPGGWPEPTAARDRQLQDTLSGVQVRIADWPAGKAAALSIRFDDSHPTHLSRAIPILNSYGLRGTFMVNPGAAEPGSRHVPDFDRQRAEWAAIAREGRHELANHSAHHRGAVDDADMDSEIGRAAEAIWAMTPGRSRLTALNLGGGTQWRTTRTLRHYLIRYHHFDASGGSLGMDDSYGGRVEAFRRMLEQHIARGLWCRIHYHSIGDGLSSSEANFRAALDVATAHQQQLWIAGMADIFKYQSERSGARLTAGTADARRVQFQLHCTTDAALYDQPLTMEVTLPSTWQLPQTTVTDAHGTVIQAAQDTEDGRRILRFEVPPQTRTYTVTHNP